MASKLVRVKFHRLRTPLYLRPEPWLFLLALAYFSYEKLSGEGLLNAERRYPQGIWRGLNAQADQFFNDHGVANQIWASPLNDLRKFGGNCTVGAVPAPFAAALAPATAYACGQDKADRFEFTLGQKGAGHFARGYGLPVAAELEAGSASLKAKPGADLELLLPNGYLSVHTEKGFTAALERGPSSLNLVVQEGLAEVEPHFTENYRGLNISVAMRAENKGKLKLPNRAPSGATKTYLAAPSGVYVQAK